MVTGTSLGNVDKAPQVSHATQFCRQPSCSAADKEARRLEQARLAEQLAHRLCRDLEQRDTRLSFYLHTSSQRVGVRVIDSDTSEVIKELPPEQQLELVARIRKMVGMILDEQV